MFSRQVFDGFLANAVAQVVWSSYRIKNTLRWKENRRFFISLKLLNPINNRRFHMYRLPHFTPVDIDLLKPIGRSLQLLLLRRIRCLTLRRQIGCSLGVFALWAELVLHKEICAFVGFVLGRIHSCTSFAGCFTFVERTGFDDVGFAFFIHKIHDVFVICLLLLFLRPGFLLRIC